MLAICALCTVLVGLVVLILIRPGPFYYLPARCARCISFHRLLYARRCLSSAVAVATIWLWYFEYLHSLTSLRRNLAGIQYSFMECSHFAARVSGEKAEADLADRSTVLVPAIRMPHASGPVICVNIQCIYELRCAGRPGKLPYMILASSYDECSVWASCHGALQGDLKLY